jgi:acetyl-CoA acetyltransferase
VNEVVVLGVGMHRFGKFPALAIQDLAREAIWQAIADAGIDPKVIEIAYVANCYNGFFTGQLDAIAPIAVKYSGLTGVPLIHVMGGSGSGSVAFHDAVLGVASGQYEVALALGVEKLYVEGDPARSINAIQTSGEQSVATELGMTWIGDLTISARRLMHRYGWTQEDFALVAAKNRGNGALNPLAELQEPITAEEVLKARVIAYPLTRPMCSSAAIDGAAAAIVCSREAAGRLLKTAAGPLVRVGGLSLAGARYVSNRVEDKRPGMLSMNEAPVAFAAAYKQAGLSPQDVELAFVHDAIAPEELLSYQVLGLCGPGEEAALLRSGATRLDGRVPVNTDGGLIARGHPIAATAFAQIHEAVIQLRGRAGKRQAYPANGRPPRVAALQNAGAQGGPGGGVAVSSALLLTT